MGVEVIEAFVKTLPVVSGVYRMIDAGGNVLYVGKAKNLKARVTSYTKPEQQSIRIQRMIHQCAQMEIISTHTEVEALLLEANLIKQLKPKYNILLRDDKSYPMLLISDHEFPRLSKHRGAKTAKGRYYGPFASSLALDSTIQSLETLFLLRNCGDGEFKSRSRPCLQYHIKRCSAPCVGYITAPEYNERIQQAEQFLTGQSAQLQRDLANKMDLYSQKQEYERAAQLRDQIHALTQIQQKQHINVMGIANADVLGFYQLGEMVAIQVFYYRFGRNFGNRSFFLTIDEQLEPAEIMEKFIMQYYDTMQPPPLLLLGVAGVQYELLADGLHQLWQQKIELRHPKRGDGVALLTQANLNAKSILNQHIAKQSAHQQLLAGLQAILGMKNPINRVEIYDNSHNQGDKPVGAMVVADNQGWAKKSYRLFNFAENKARAGADDFAMMYEMLHRRFARAIAEGQGEQTTHGQNPDLIMIDGGKGQLSQAVKILQEFNLYDSIFVVGIAKGEDRHAGRETIYIPPYNGEGAREIALDKDHPVQYFIQNLRDEAHRFAIGAHRKKRSRAISQNPLNDITGIGAKKKQALMRHFGSYQAIKDAGIQDYMQVQGISQKIAENIYNFFKS